MNSKNAVILIIAACVSSAFSQSNQPLLMAHFMPWNTAPPVEDDWGWHWTMNSFDPENIDAAGRREIASHFYPLTGPYDSMDPDILEYQILLMKISGIDGILVDWYGIGDLWDYPAIHKRTQAVFDAVENAGLLFAIVYEDQTIKHMVSQNVLTEDMALDHAKQVMAYLESTWFNKDAYYKIDNRPVLLNFGPQYFKMATQWQKIFADLSVEPLFFTLDNRLTRAAAGAFSWPPMWKSNSDGVLTQAALDEYLDQFSQKAADWDYRISSSFPGFLDIYKEAGTGEGYGVLDHQNGETLKKTLDHALADNPHAIQLVTWNDYGEGTIIEPTREFEYRYLEIVQDFKKQHIDNTLAFQSNHLTLPLEILNLRRDNPANAPLNTTLDRVFQLLITDKPDSAIILLKGLGVQVIQDKDEKSPVNYSLQQNFPNPFNPQTTIQFVLPALSNVTLSIYNTTGQLVCTLFDGVRGKGRHTFNWAGRDKSGQPIAGGTYFVVLKSPHFDRHIKMIYLK